MKITKIYTAILLFFVFSCAFGKNNYDLPWVNCGKDFEKAKKIAGFNFPLKLKNYNIMATEGQINVIYTIHGKKVTVIKTAQEKTKGNFAEYAKSSVNTETEIIEEVIAEVRKSPFKNKFYTVYFDAEQGYYTMICKRGLSLKEVQNIYYTIAEAETSSLPPIADY